MVFIAQLATNSHATNLAYIFQIFRYFVLDGVSVRLIGMPESGRSGDSISSEPLQDFLLSYNLPKVRKISSYTVQSMAKMLHYSSGRRGYYDN